MSAKSVYIVNKSSHDFSRARKWGNLVFMSEGSISRFSASKMFRLFEPFINDSQKEDYILLTSMTIMCSIACGMFGSKHQRLNLLLYKPPILTPTIATPDQEGDYLARTIIF